MGLVATLVAGLSLGASSVALVTGNRVAAAQARAAADRGLELALAAALPVLSAWRTEGFATVEDALNDALGGGRLRRAMDAGGFTGAPEPRPLLDGAEVVAMLLDDDAPVRGLSAADVADIGEDADPAHDANRRLVIRAVGRHRSGAMATVEALVGAAPVPAVHLRGPARLGAVAVSGLAGDVAVLGDLEAGDGLDVAGTAAATGLVAGAGARRVRAGARAVPLPEVEPAWYQPHADVVLHRDGSVGCRLPEARCPAVVLPWRATGGAWTLVEPPAAGALVFVDGDAVLAPSGDPVQLSVVAAGQVRVASGFRMRPHREGLLLLAGGDIRVEAVLEADAEEGLVAAAGRIRIAGPSRLAGAVVALGRPQGQTPGAPGDGLAASELDGGVRVRSAGALAAQQVLVIRALGFRRYQAW